MSHIGGSLFTMINKTIQDKDIKSYFKKLDSSHSLDNKKDESRELFEDLLKFSKVTGNTTRAQERKDHRKKILMEKGIDFEEEDLDGRSLASYNKNVESVIHEQSERQEIDSEEDSQESSSFVEQPNKWRLKQSPGLGLMRQGTIKYGGRGILDDVDGQNSARNSARKSRYGSMLEEDRGVRRSKWGSSLRQDSDKLLDTELKGDEEEEDGFKRNNSMADNNKHFSGLKISRSGTSNFARD